jgi:hypothetical protein
VKKKILIATPTDGNPMTAVVSFAYHAAVSALRAAHADYLEVVPGTLMFNDDLARARSRAVWYALEPERDGTWDYLLWIDDDVAFDHDIVPRMIESAVAGGFDVLAAPYPRKRIPTSFPYRPLTSSFEAGGFRTFHSCAEVEAVAFGFVLTSRHCLTSMVKRYASEWFTDMHQTEHPREIVALFKQVHTDPVLGPDGKARRDLFSEDYSFCHRWRAMGGSIHMYMGPGTPLGHVGGHMYRGGMNEIGSV